MTNKTCSKCQLEKPLEQYSRDRKSGDGMQAYCKSCDSEKGRQYRQRNRVAVQERKKRYRQTNRDAINSRRKESRVHNIERELLSKARCRAKKGNLPFDLELEDIKIPDICPLLGIKLSVGRGGHKPNSPTVDRIVPSKGYIKGNVWVISHRANTIKNNSTIEEFTLICSNWLKTIGSSLS